jgi:hypothetical protein
VARAVRRETCTAGRRTGRTGVAAPGDAPQRTASVILMLGSPRSWLGRWLLLVAALWLMGLGGGTEGGSGSNIPIPQENFTVTVADRSGQSLEAKRFTWEGKVEFRGQIGNATVNLPFNKVRSVRVVSAEGDKAATLAKANITLRSGESVDVMIDRSTKCYGETKFGKYEIFFKDVASIQFQE